MKTTTAAVAVGVALLVGTFSGAAMAGQPVTRTPSACHEMADLAMEAFQLQADMVAAVRERGDALDPDTYAVHDGEVNHLLASLDVIAPKYDAAEDDCLGDS